MLAALTTGLILGLSSGLAPGPLFVLVISCAIKHNYKEGIKVAAAPLLTDAPIILISVGVVAGISGWHRALGVISLAGALYILYLSGITFKTKPMTLGETETPPRSLRSGIIINLLNPHPYLFWLAFGGPFLFRLHNDDSLAPFAFIFGFYLLLVGSKVFLALVAGKSRTFLAGKNYVRVMRTLAAMLAFFAFLLIKDALNLLGF